MLERCENRYGYGFFSTVLMLVVRPESICEIGPSTGVQALQISTNGPDEGGPFRRRLQRDDPAVLQDRWLELRGKLGYDKRTPSTSCRALADYLDGRFSITDWAKARLAEGTLIVGGEIKMVRILQGSALALPSSRTRSPGAEEPMKQKALIGACRQRRHVGREAAP